MNIALLQMLYFIFIILYNGGMISRETRNNKYKETIHVDHLELINSNILTSRDCKRANCNESMNFDLRLCRAIPLFLLETCYLRMRGFQHSSIISTTIYELVIKDY